MIYIIIPTYKRLKKLERCLNSIFNSTYQDYRIVIVADNNDADTVILAHRLQNDRIDVLVQPRHLYVVGATNRFCREYIDREWDAYVMLCDDVELTKDCLEKVVAIHKECFPDGDGVVGINQKCPGHPNYTFKWFGQTLIGKPFLRRYKDVDYQILQPDYMHFFCDEELHRYANKLNKFAIAEEAVLYHYHPGYVSEEMDATHNIIRSGDYSPKEHDNKVYEIRQCNHLTWGLSWIRTDIMNISDK
jgi:glycosyltransferase involved in cell wall biosynthesis